MSKSSHPEMRHGLLLDRRTFLSTAALTAGAVVASAMMPASVAHACEADVTAMADAEGLWSVDVMCGHWPPYSHPIPYGRLEAVHATATLAAAGHMFGLDQMLVA